MLVLNSLVTGLHYAQIPLAQSQRALGKPGPNGSFPVARLQKERQKEGGNNREKESERFSKKEREKEKKNLAVFASHGVCLKFMAPSQSQSAREETLEA